MQITAHGLKDTPAPTRFYGWKKDRLDPRHRTMGAANPLVARLTLPAKVDLRHEFPAPYDQGQTSSCTGNMMAAILERLDTLAHPHRAPFTPSRLFMYYFARLMEGTQDADAGAQICDIMAVAARLGSCPETTWRFDATELLVRPDDAAVRAALALRGGTPVKVTQTVWSMRTALARGLPIGLGITVFDSFESDAVARSGVVPLPGKSAYVGGHAIVVVGYDNDLQVFICRNSWGTDWGGPMKGYFTIPYAYLTNSSWCSDLWVVPGLNPTDAQAELITTAR